MPEENAVVAQSDATDTQVNSEVVTDAAKPSAEGGEETQQESQEQGEPQHKRPGGWQRKIAKLTEQNEFLMQELLKRGQQTETKPAEPKPAVSAKPNPDDFQTTGEYVEALTDWKASEVVRKYEERVAQEAKQREEKAAKETAAKTFSARVDAARGKYEDFDEVVFENESVHISQQVADILSDKDNESGAELAYYLGKHPEDADRISKLTSPVAIARELGKIEAGFASQKSEQEAVSNPPATSKAPPPIKPVSRAAVTDTGLSDTLSPEEWTRRREAQLKKRN